VLLWLESTGIAQWVGLSLYAYPSLLALHITGLAVVVGIFLMRDLRLLGLLRNPAPGDFIKPARLAWAGFALNAISGFMLFSSQASIFALSNAFRFKISFILLGMVLAVLIQRRLQGSLDETVDDRTRLLAGISLLCWLAAIIAGRLIAYLG
jgi:hypothetical protein